MTLIYWASSHLGVLTLFAFLLQNFPREKWTKDPLALKPAIYVRSSLIRETFLLNMSTHFRSLALRVCSVNQREANILLSTLRRPVDLFSLTKVTCLSVRWFGFFFCLFLFFFCLLVCFCVSVCAYMAVTHHLPSDNDGRWIVTEDQDEDLM